MTNVLALDPERRAPRLAPWGAVLAIAGATIGGWVGVPLALLGAFVMLLACVSRVDGFLLLGPVASAELARAARLGNPWLWRSIYALFAGLIVYLNLAAYIPFDELFAVPQLSRKALAEVNLSISLWFAVVLMSYTAILTVQVMAGVVAEEREKKRWETLLTTDLRGREILFGKLAGRLPVLLDPLLSALPVLAALPMFGGVPPWLAGATALTCVALMFGLGGMSLFYSLFAATRSGATGTIVLTCVMYVILVLPLTFFLATSPLADFPRAYWPGSPFTLGDLLYPFICGSPLSAGILLSRSGVDLEIAAPRAAWHFALFHFAVFFLFSLTAVRRLPRAAVWGQPGAETMTGRQRVKAAAKQAQTRDLRPTDPLPVLKPEKQAIERPPIGDWPVTWWERYGWLSKGQANFVRHVFTWRLLVVGAISLVVFTTLRMVERSWPSNGLRQQDRAEILFVPVFLVAAFFLFPVPFRAARCVAKERAGDTMEALLLLPLSRQELLFQKWFGVCLCDWPGFAGLLVWLLPAMLMGFVPVAVVLMFAVGWFVAVGFLAALGLYLSTVSRTPQGAVFRTGLTLFALVFGINLLVIVNGYGGHTERTAAAVPPFAYTFLQDELNRMGPPLNQPGQPAVLLFAGLVGSLAYACAGYFLWYCAVRRFEREYGA